MKQMLKGLFLGAALLILTAAPAAAQDLSGGYALVNWNGCCAHGFMIDYSHPIVKAGGINIEALADFGWTRFGEPDNETDTTYSGGARFRVLPFGEPVTNRPHASADALATVDDGHLCAHLHQIAGGGKAGEARACDQYGDAA